MLAHLRTARFPMCLAIAATLLGGCGDDSGAGDGEGTSTEAAEHVIREFIEAGATSDCETVERLSTEHFQSWLGCDWMTSWRGDYTIKTIVFEPDGPSADGELDADVNIELSAVHNGMVNFGLVERDGSWLIDEVNVM